MKARKEIVDAVEELLNQNQKYKTLFIKNEEIWFVLIGTYELVSSQREIRAAIQELRNSGRVKLLIASGKGYKFATTTAEVQAYLKRLHKKAMQDLRLMGNIKEQAESQLGLQVNFEFWNEIYKQTK